MNFFTIRQAAFAVMVCCVTTLAQAQTVFINEIHYDNSGADVGEGVEIAGPAGTNLTGWLVQPYNGSGGVTYTPTGSSIVTIPDLGGGYGTVCIPIAGLQNGAPDGIALVNPSSVVVQFLSYEGSFLATNGPANGMTSTNIGVSQAGTTTGQSLQLTGTGTTYTHFTWATESASNCGAFNNGQTFGSVNTSVAFNGSSNSVSETIGTTPLTLSITDPGGVGFPTNVDVVLISGPAARINGYTTQTVIFPGGSATDEILTITVTDNGVNDGNAVLVFELQNISGGQGTPAVGSPSQFTLTVLDDEAPPTVGFDLVSSSVLEGGVASIGVTMNAAPGANVTLDVIDLFTGTAVSGTDYTALGTVTLTYTPSDTYPFTQNVSVTTLPDGIYQGPLTVILDASIVTGSATLGTTPHTLTINDDELPPLFINEVDADQAGTDAAEFVELYGPANFPLDGMVLVFWNGATDVSYHALDLDGQSLDATGFWVAGNTGVPNVDIILAGNLLQNGADAVALYVGDGTSFPNGTALTLTGLIDALVYDTDDSDDVGLLTLLNASQPQVNENGSLNGTVHSMSRVPDGGVQRNTDTYVTQFPTPGTTNSVTCDLVIQPEFALCNTITAGTGDFYNLSIPYTGVEPGVVVINGSGSGTVGGDNPAVTTNGTIVISNINEANAYSITFTSPCNSITISGPAPICEPLPEIVINEVDYDDPLIDSTEFVELKNIGGVAIDLNGFSVQLVNGNGGGATIYNTIVLPSFSLAPGAYYVISNDPTLPNLDLLVTPAFNLIQNGNPDAVALRDASNNLLDVVSYGGLTGAPYNEGSGAPVDVSPPWAPDASIGRFPDGSDTDNNGTDFVLSCSRTPGTTNNPAAGDADGDLVNDCLDGCPLDPLKTAPGVCGCGNPETGDTDFDGVADCIDGCPLDPFKIAPGQCGCGVPDTDTDSDLIADCIDSCPTFPGQNGDLCDDGDPFTTGDQIVACACTGTPLPCTNWTLTINTDAAGSETTWQIIHNGTANVLASGGPYPPFTDVLETICIPTGLCWDLTMNDSGCNGISPGGWLLKDNNGKPIINNVGNGGGFTCSATPSSPFCTPTGTDQLTWGTCDREDLLPSSVIVASENPAVSAEFGVTNATSGYQFWIFDPLGGYSVRRFLSHASGGAGTPGPTSCNHLKLSTIIGNPVPAGVLLNVRVRNKVNGAYGDFGKVCRLKIDPAAAACPTTQLDNNPQHIGTTYSCGVTGLDLNGSDKIWAIPVVKQPGNVPANRYRFQFELIAEGYLKTIVQNTYVHTLVTWPVNPLQYNKTYTVRVQASFNGGATWCAWGADCTIQTSVTPPSASSQRDVVQEISQLLIYPNPNRGEQLFLTLDEVATDLVTVDMFDMFGKRVVSNMIPSQGGMLHTVVELNNTLASGLYTVVLTAGEQTYTERLVIE